MSDTTTGGAAATTFSIDASPKRRQRVVRVGDKTLREPRMHTLGDQINLTEADNRTWGNELIILPVPMTDLFDIEVYEKNRIRLIPKTSLAASLLWDWLGTEPKMAWMGVNAQATGKDDTLNMEIRFDPRKEPESPAPPPKPAKKKKGKAKLRRHRPSVGGGK